MSCRIDESRLIAGAARSIGLIAALWCAIALGLAVPVGAQQPAPVSVAPLPAYDPAGEPSIVELPLNKAQAIEFDRPVRDVIIANPDIADVIVKTPTKIYLVARAIGDTDIFFTDGDGNVMQHFIARVDIDIAAATAAIAEVLPNATIALKGVNNNIVLTGIVRTAKESADVSAIAQRFVKDEANVINMLRILEDQQVLLQVRVAEMQRNVLKNLGLITNFNRVFSDSGVSISTTGGDTMNVAARGNVIFNTLGFQNTAFTTLERQGLIKTLAEPTLTAISGETANFLAGGEFPVPSGRDQQGNIQIQFKQFGILLSFTPVVLADGQINLRIKTEVSRIAEELALMLADIEVKGVSVRRAESTVNLPSGGNLMIAGLLQNDEFNQIDGVPWLKDVPVLGALFRSTEFQHNQSELVVLVRAFLVRSVEPDKRLALPTDGFVPASDFDIFLLGRLYKEYSKGTEPGNIPFLQGPFGYIMR